MAVQNATASASGHGGGDAAGLHADTASVFKLLPSRHHDDDPRRIVLLPVPLRQLELELVRRVRLQGGATGTPACQWLT